MSFRALITATALFAASHAQAQAALTCATVGGAGPFTAPTGVAVDLAAGETLSISTPNPATLAISIEFGGQGGTDDSLCNPAFPGSADCDGFSHTATQTGMYLVDAFNQPGDTFTLSCGVGGATPGGASAGVTGAQTSAALVAAQTATGAIGGAVASASAGTQAAVTRDGLFLSTSGASTALQAWLSLQARSYDGTVDGRSHEFTLGADFEVGAQTRLGLLLSSGKADLDVGGLAVDVDALSFGPYFKTRFGQHYELTGFYVFARPEYDIAGTSYRADRQAGGLNLTASYSWGATEIDSFLGLSGFAEDHPAAGALAARTVSGLTGSIGTRATFARGAALRPYVSLGADFSQFDDGLGATDTHGSPRLGTGFTWNSEGSTFSMDLNGGQIIEDTRDVELRMKYNLNF